MAIWRFDVIQPDSLEEAVAALARHGQDAQLIAGGTDLLRDIHLGLKRPRWVISLDRIQALGLISERPDGSLAVGSCVTMTALGADERVARRATALAEAARGMGSPQVRNRATVGGNLCNARPCADTAPPAIVCDALLLLSGAAGSREVACGEYMTGPGQTVRKPDEILREIRLPRLPPHSGSAFLSATNRKAVEITITSAAVRITLESSGGPIREAMIALGSVGPIPLRSPAAEAVLVGQLPVDTLLARAASAAVGDSRPIDDMRAGAAYRRWMVETLVARALQIACQRAREGST